MSGQKTKCILCIYFQVVVVSYSCNGMMLKKFNGGRTSNSLFNEDFEDYYDYEEPLPQGPTRPPPSSISKKVTFSPDTDYPEEDYYDYYEEEELPQGPTREPPLPSGPTRRPGQATSLSPGRARPLSPALSQVLSLPLLTTKRPRKLKLPKKNITCLRISAAGGLGVEEQVPDASAAAHLGVRAGAGQPQAGPGQRRRYRRSLGSGDYPRPAGRTDPTSGRLDEPAHQYRESYTCCNMIFILGTCIVYVHTMLKDVLHCFLLSSSGLMNL